MRLANVDGQKIRVVLIVFVNLNDVAHLAAEGRSSKTPKHQHERPLMGSFADVETANAIQRDNPRVRRVAAHFQLAAMHVRQGIPHHRVRVLRASRHEGQRGKSSNEQHAQNSCCPFQETIHLSLLQPINLGTLQGICIFLSIRQKADPSLCSGSQPKRFFNFLSKRKPMRIRHATRSWPLPPMEASTKFRPEKKSISLMVVPSRVRPLL